MLAFLRKAVLLLLAGAALGFIAGLYFGPKMVHAEYAVASGLVANPCVQTATDATDKLINYILLLGLGGALALPIGTGAVTLWWRRRQARKNGVPLNPPPPASGLPQKPAA